MIEPRRWQTEAMQAWRPTGQGVVSVVTGAGKTALALLLYDELSKKAPDLHLVVVVPTLALLDQWVVAIETEMGIPEDEIATFSGESRSSTTKKANVAVINTARTLTSRLARARPCFFVVDECHRAGAPQNARALRIDAEYTLGLSATPVREFDDGFERYVRPALGPIIYEYGYEEARRDGIIADFALHNYRFPMSATETAEYMSLSRRIDRFTAGKVKILNDPRLGQLRAKRSRFLLDSPRRTAAAVAVSQSFSGRQLLFHERIQRADQIAGLLDARGTRVAVYHSHLGAAFRRRNLELFKAGQFDTLVTCRALDEGLNVPDASVGVIAASTSSTRQRIQRLGRVLRPAPGKVLASVATIYATQAEEEFLRVEAAKLGEVAETHWYEISI